MENKTLEDYLGKFPYIKRCILTDADYKKLTDHFKTEESEFKMHTLSCFSDRRGHLPNAFDPELNALLFTIKVSGIDILALQMERDEELITYKDVLFEEEFDALRKRSEAPDRGQSIVVDTLAIFGVFPPFDHIGDIHMMSAKIKGDNIAWNDFYVNVHLEEIHFPGTEETDLYYCLRATTDGSTTPSPSTILQDILKRVDVEYREAPPFIQKLIGSASHA